MNRRALLRVGLTGAVGAGIGLLGASIDRTRLLSAAIRFEFRDFADLGDTPERYAADFAATYGGIAFGEQMYLNFLLSTDFFLGGEDPLRRLSYVGLYDPYVNPCLVTVPRRQP